MLFNKRKIYFIKKDFQSRFILRFVAIATAWAAVSVSLFAYLAKKRLDSIRYSSYVDVKTTSDLLLPITISVHVISLLIFAGILASTIYSLWKRLSSPLQKIKSDISMIAIGDLTGRVTIDRDEEFQDLAEDIEGMRSALHKRIVRIKDHQRGLAMAVAELDRSTHEGISPGSSAAFLRDTVERMKAEVEAFHY
jgi:methyl-accepting chemotaxis protein